MGEAKRRGSKEQRIEEAVKKKVQDSDRKKRLTNRQAKSKSALLAAALIGMTVSGDTFR